MTFLYFEYFIFLLIIPFYFYKYKANKDSIFLFLCFVFILISLARPIFYSNIINQKEIKSDIVIALDFSKSMLATDIKPNRFEFAKKKVDDFLSKLQNEKVSILGFSNQAYIITPLSNNYKALRFLNENISLGSINKNGTDYLKILKASNEILKNRVQKNLIIFTDGGEEKNFSKEISFANKNNIIVNIYNIATIKGSPIRYSDELLKDKNNNIVVSRLNKSIGQFSTSTNGMYLEYSLKDDLNTILNNIKQNSIKEYEKDKYQNKKELFLIPLIFAFVFFILARFDIKKGIR